MRRINTIRSFGGGLRPPLMCLYRGGEFLSCLAYVQESYRCREATRADFTREEWDNTPCAGPVLGPYETVTTAVSPGVTYAGQAAPPAVNIVNERMLAEERARILANQNRMEEERLARLRVQEEEHQRQAVRQEQERQRLVQLERERLAAEQERQRLAQLERERLAAEQEQARIQAELERNRQQQALRQGTGSTGTPASAETETAGSFPWWLLGLLLLQ